MDSEANDQDEVLEALEELARVLVENNERNLRSLERADDIKRWRAEGRSYRDIVTGEPRPLIVELIAENMNRFATVGSRLRRAEARALRAEGMTMDAIAEVFGVTRQRISELLRSG